MPLNIILRTATQYDANAITDVYLRSRKAFLSFAPLQHSDERVHQWIREVVIPSGLAIVAEKNSIIVGMMALAKEQGVGWIEQLYITPAAVSQGIGALFVNKAKEVLGSPIRLYTFQQNIRAHNFYEQHGFQMVQLRGDTANEEGCPDAVYEWL